MYRNFLKLIPKALLTILLFTAFSKTGIAQTAKPHFVIHNPGNAADNPNYEYALKDFDFDSYRFYDKRRTIKFTNSDVTIELYSAKELLDIYGKPVSPFTLMDNKPKKEIEFYFYPSQGKVKINELN
jgi:hypothetical protein